MELRQLQYVLAVAKARNFTRAAQKLTLAQPSLSQQIAKLERELGQPLFHRNKQQVELTYAGNVFVEKAQTILDMVDQLKTELEDVAQLKKGRLVIGSLPMTGSHVMPVILPVFRERHPEIEVVLVEDTTARLELLTVSGETDLSLLSLPISSDELEYVPLLEEDILLALPPTDPMKSVKNNVSLDRFSDRPFILLKRGQGFREITLNLCHRAGFSPNIVFESNNIETVQSLVAAGMGVALVPKMVKREASSIHAPVYLPLSDAGASRQLVIGYRKHRYLSNAAVAFIATVNDVMKHAPQF